MKRAAIAAITAWLACASSPAIVDPKPALVLSAADPRGELAAVIDGDLLELSLIKIHNPKQQAFVVKVSLPCKSCELGQIAPFPLDQPGKFTLRVPPNQERRLIVELLAAANDRPLQSPLEVSFAAPVFTDSRRR